MEGGWRGKSGKEMRSEMGKEEAEGQERTLADA